MKDLIQEIGQLVYQYRQRGQGLESTVQAIIGMLPNKVRSENYEMTNEEAKNILNNTDNNPPQHMSYQHIMHMLVGGAYLGIPKFTFSTSDQYVKNYQNWFLDLGYEVELIPKPTIYGNVTEITVKII